jgi:hypothetical protein
MLEAMMSPDRWTFWLGIFFAVWAAYDFIKARLDKSRIDIFRGAFLAALAVTHFACSSHSQQLEKLSSLTTEIQQERMNRAFQRQLTKQEAKIADRVVNARLRDMLKSASEQFAVWKQQHPEKSKEPKYRSIPIKIRFTNGDSEALKFGLQLRDVLRGCGFEAGDPEHVSFMPPVKGIRLLFNGDTVPKEHSVLSVAFREAGYENVNGYSIDDPKLGDFEFLDIGWK